MRRRPNLLQRGPTVPAAVLAVLLLVSPAIARAACAPPELLVTHATAVERELLCDAWRRTIALLAPVGGEPRTVVVDVGHSAADEGRFAAHLGYLDAERDVVGMAELDTYLAGGLGGFGEPPSTKLWTSFAVHEPAHALIHPHLAVLDGRRVVHAFVAYAKQLAALDGATITRIVERYDATAFPSEHGINEVVYAMAPNRFGVRAYLTVSGSKTPAAYLQARLRDGFKRMIRW